MCVWIGTRVLSFQEGKLRTILCMPMKSLVVLGTFALKLDVSKAYNQVEWEFLEHMKLCMDFHCQWVALVL